MAALSDRRPSGADDRGQLILVTGLAVAVTLVAMVLLLNTVIYTQNLATRGAQVEDGEAVAFRGEVAADVDDLLDAENREEYGSWSDAQDGVRRAIFRYDDLRSRHYAERGTVAEIERGSLSLTEGAIVRQTADSRNFTNATGEAADWTLVEDASDVRNFRLTVSDEELADDEDDAFGIVLAGDSETRTFRVYRSDGDIAVSDGGGADPCTVSESEATVDLTAGTVGGTDCSILEYPTEIGPYDVSFENADRATGTYELTLDTSDGASVEESNFAAAGATESPRWANAAYAADFEVHFETSRVVFHDAVRAAPGEPR